MVLLVDIAAGLFPVFAFLGALILLDSYKLIKVRAIIIVILEGGIAAFLAFLLNSIFVESFDVDFVTFSRYVSPVIEETVKVTILIILLRRRKIGFMVDAAIYGFAIGAGFSFVENIYYLQTLQESNLLLWIIRGFGTAIMHGGTIALFGIVTKYLSDRYSRHFILQCIPGFLFAMLIHSAYNHFFLSPVASTIGIMIILPTLMIMIFRKSEELTRQWLGVGLDADMELLDLITVGNFTDSKIGQYLQSLTTRFAPEIIVDMLCLLRLHTELSIRAKGVLLMREAGFREEPNPEIKEKFEELKFLEKSIGATGKMAMAPFIHTKSQDLWQLYMAEE